MIEAKEFEVKEFEVTPPRTPTFFSRLKTFKMMMALIWVCLKTGYRFRLIVTEDPTQNE